MAIGYNGPERRQSKRVRVNLSVMYRTKGALDVCIQTERGEFSATMVDIGEGGLAILTGAELDRSSLIWVKFTLLKPNENQVSFDFFGLVECLGEIRDTTLLSDGCYRVGIAFTRIDEDCKKDIARFIQCLGIGVTAERNGERSDAI
ncbi:MAG: PilZ domain-containing protein [Candidatus Omnitrophota bacterium]|jgi:c-di-GMP-binding flagellar brake protein YcgR